MLQLLENKGANFGIISFTQRSGTIPAMDTLTWKKFFDILAFVVVFAVPVILYLMEKAGASLTWIFIVGWLSIGVAALYLVLNLPWVWVNASLAVRIWRISFVSAVALLVVGYGATKIWP